MNLRNALIKDSVSNEDAVSMWTARRVRHVNITPYRLTLVLPRRTWNGPKQSIPV